MYVKKINYLYRTYELRVLELWIDEDIGIPVNANLMIDVGAPLTFMETTLFETIIHYVCFFVAILHLN